MTGLSFLAAMVFGWALGCGLLYALLRYLNIHFAPAVRCMGAWVLVMWVLFYAALASPPPTHGGATSPDALKLSLYFGVVIFGGFGLGSLLLRFVPHHSELWWHDVLFCALYFGCAHVWGYALLVCWPSTEGPLYEIARWHGEKHDDHLLMLCAWLFPLGAPLMELIGRSLWRLHTELAS